jgi:hypothetical protein
MKTVVLTAALLLGAALPSTAWQQDLDGDWRARLQDTWTRKDGEQWVSIQMYGDRDRQFGFSVPMTELEGLGVRGDRWTASDVRFDIRRDAGTVRFQGNFTEGRGSGTWRFTPNAEYVTAMRKTYGDADLSSEGVFRLAIHDVSRRFITSIQGEGYPRVPLDDLTKMRIHGVDAPYVQGLRKAGYDKLSIDELVKTRIHGATPQFAQDVKSAGLQQQPTIDELVKMRIHGVSADFIREMRELGYAKLTIDELVQLRIHGVSSAFVREMRDLGYKDVSLNKFVEMRIHGVNSQFVRDLRDLGYTNVGVDDLVRLRIHGVTPEFIRDVKGAGFKEMTPDDLVAFKIQGGQRWLRKRGA